VSDSEVVAILAIGDDGQWIEVDEADVGADEELVLVAAPGGIVAVVCPPPEP
jgi:hypothetical protein